MTLYELNQANYTNLPSKTQEELAKIVPYIVSFLDKHKSKYYLLLERESRYYTLFTFPKGNYNPGQLAHELIDLIQHLGEVKSIEEDAHGEGMLEIWLTPHGEKECRLYGLFDYSEGVIEIL